jgi:ABC-type multidrug transport system fused ATPase/permease subunit
MHCSRAAFSGGGEFTKCALLVHFAAILTGGSSLRGRTVDNAQSAFSSERIAFVSLLGVSFSYPGKNRIEVLSKVEFDLRHGELFVLLGPSGCGQDHGPQHARRFRASERRSDFCRRSVG